MNSLQSPSKALLLLLIFTLSAMTFNSCVKEQDFTKETYFSPESREIIVTNLFGLVVDENDLPIVDSEVRLKTVGDFEVIRTDENGNFTFLHVRVPREGAFLTVRQAGKFEAFRKMNVTPNSYNYTKIKLLDKTIIGSLPSMNGGAVNHSSSAKLELPANGVRYENGENYEGNVAIAMSWIDPTAKDLASRMVGDLSGLDENGQKMALGTFGMLNVELLGDNGEALQLKEGKPAKLTFPIPAEILGQAPSTIPLWYYDEALETWIEDGEATLQGSYYVGKVAHFSSWNVDTKENPIAVIGEVFARIDDIEVEVPYLQVYVSIEGVRRAGGFLDDSGAFEFYNFPANTAFTLSILGQCEEVLLEEELGPYASDTDLGRIVVQAHNSGTFLVKGLGVDCEGDAVQNGYVKVKVNNTLLMYPLKEEGIFEFTVHSCYQTSSAVSLMDVGGNKVSNAKVFDLDKPVIEVGKLTACEETPGFIIADINDGENYFLFLNAVAFFENENLNIYSGTQANLDAIPHFTRIVIPNVTGIGTYDIDIVGGVSDTEENPNLQCFPITTTIHITQFGNEPGDIIKGTFYGQDEAESAAVQRVEGRFKIVR